MANVVYPFGIYRDAKTQGEVVFRGNLVMKGYLKREKDTQEALAHGWFHSGDIAVRHPDGYIELQDRKKDIIISGGEVLVSTKNILRLHTTTGLHIPHKLGVEHQYH